MSNFVVMSFTSHAHIPYTSYLLSEFHSGFHERRKQKQ